MLTYIVVIRRTSVLYMRMYVVCIHTLFVYIRIHAHLHIRTQVRLCSSIYDKYIKRTASHT